MLSSHTFKTANHFALLHNLDSENTVLHGRQEQYKSTPVQTTRNTEIQGEAGNKIPTIINGRLSFNHNKNTISKNKKKSTCASDPNLIIKEHKVKVKVIGDSHLKKIAVGIDQFLTSKFEVTSWIKPGARMKELVGTMEKDCKYLGKSDVIVINGGANDISSMKTHTINVVGKMARFVQKYNNTNIIIANIPLRYDLEKSSVINSEILAFNKQLIKIEKAYSHVNILETNFDRKLFTRHGMHLNKRGKEWLSKSLAAQISKLVSNKDTDVPKIALKWKDELSINQDPNIHMPPLSPSDQSTNTNNNIQVETLDTETIIPRSSNRQKRVTCYPKQGFFMETVTLNNYTLPSPLSTNGSGPKITKNKALTVKSL